MDMCRIPVLFLFFQSFGTDFGYVPAFASSKVFYRQLHIFPSYHNLDYELNDHEGEVLKNTVNNVVLYVKKILSVIPTQGNLLLERNACKSSWIGGRNAGKCAAIKKNYDGEFCLDNFMIPDDHLEAFYTWTNKPLPDRTWYTDGNGLRNTDYVLYIRAKTTKSCLSNFLPEISENLLIAYASYCKLGKNDRPIAGYINFCPSEFKKYQNDRNKLILVTLHEVFHALGFSKDLILNFRDFREVLDNTEHPHYGFPILRENNGTYRLLTPTLISRMYLHFDCCECDLDISSIGAPMVTKDGILKSHWNSNVFPGSIMTSKLGKPEYTFVDPMTLAVFRDTGWYLVNFSNGDEYLWGQRQGCDFLKSVLSNEIPKQEENLCSNTYTSGCNYLQTEVINCQAKNAVPISDVGKSVQDCRFNSSGPFYDKTVQHEVMGRCILYRKDLSVTGRCITTKCSQDYIWMKLRNTDPNWFKCPFGELIEDPVDGGFISCPSDDGIFCYRRELPLYLQDLVTLEATTVTQRPRATYPITQSNMYGVEQITREHVHIVNIGWSQHFCATNIARSVSLLVILLLLMKYL